MTFGIPWIICSEKRMWKLQGSNYLISEVAQLYSTSSYGQNQVTRQVKIKGERKENTSSDWESNKEFAIISNPPQSQIWKSHQKQIFTIRSSFHRSTSFRSSASLLMILPQSEVFKSMKTSSVLFDFTICFWNNYTNKEVYQLLLKTTWLYFMLASFACVLISSESRRQGIQ